VLVTVLQRDLGVMYSPDRVHDPDFTDSRDLFLHGLLSGRRQGTCISLPVLYVGVGEAVAVGVAVAVAVGVGLACNGTATYFESLGMPLVNTVTTAGPEGKRTGFDVTVLSDQSAEGSPKGK